MMAASIPGNKDVPGKRQLNYATVQTPPRFRRTRELLPGYRICCRWLAGGTSAHGITFQRLWYGIRLKVRPPITEKDRLKA